MGKSKRVITVVSFLWEDPKRARDYKFTAKHVRILKRMVDRNLTLPHRFVCVTDEKIKGIKTVPIDWTTHVPGMCFVKLMMWRKDIGEFLGDRIFYLDLDVVITGNIDAIAGRQEPIVLYHNPNYHMGGPRAFYQGSVQLFNAGVWPSIYDNFVEFRKIANWRFGGAEQALLSEALPWNLPYWDQNDGIYGAGRLGDWNKEGVTHELPEDARIVVFPGNREPSQKEVQERAPWIKRHYK